MVRQVKPPRSVALAVVGPSAWPGLAESGTKCQPHRFMRIVFFRVTWAHIPGRLRPRLGLVLGLGLGLGPRLLPTAEH